MIYVKLIGRQMVPATAELGLTYDENAELVRFTVQKPWADVFNHAGLQCVLRWIAPNGQTGIDALTMAPGEEALHGEWTPPKEALMFCGTLRAEICCMVLGEVVWHSMPLRLTLLKSLEDEGYETLIVPKYKAVTIQVEALPENTQPFGSVNHTADCIDFSFGIPAMQGIQGVQGEQGEKGDQGIQGEKGEKGAIGNVLFATFEVDTASRMLYMIAPDAYTGPGFRLNYETRGLEVVVGAVA